MQRTIGARYVLATVSALAVIAAGSGAMAQPADPLVQLLVQRGVISAHDAAGIKTRDQLTQLLVRRGVISPQDAAGLGAPPTVVAAPAPAAVAPPPPPPAAIEPSAPAPPPVVVAPPAPVSTPQSPLSFRIGAFDFTPGGFIDFETIIRSSNTGNSVGTNFGQVPFSNTVAGHQNDFRLTGQNTRLSLKADGRVWGNDVTGYVEMDFNGNDAQNVFVESNSHTPRLRLAYVDVTHGRFELQAGQLWSWATPNRVGVSAAPGDIFTTYNYDANYIAGLVWARQAAIRTAWHPNDNWAFGLSVEDPDQFVGVGEVTFPTAFNAQLATQVDAGNNIGAPATAPDFIPKVAFDAYPGGQHFHVEALGLFRAIHITDLKNGVFVKHTAITPAGGLNANLEVLKGFTLVANGMYGQAIGRYAGALGPDFVAVPSPDGTDVNISPVVGASGVVGAEWQISDESLVAAYGGEAFFHKNRHLDTTAGAPPGRFVGFGGPNSANSNNRLVKEISVDYVHTFWRDPQYGALQAGAQFSTVVREPWFVAAGAPKDAISHMAFIDLRYILP